VFVYALPFDQYEQRRRDLGIEKSMFATQPMALSGMNVSSARSNKLLDSTVSGAITGGILQGIKRQFPIFIACTKESIDA
jgi:hypothetical protein